MKEAWEALAIHPFQHPFAHPRALGSMRVDQRSIAVQAVHRSPPSGVVLDMRSRINLSAPRPNLFDYTLGRRLAAARARGFDKAFDLQPLN